jgi:hypothetical protein
MLGQNVRRQVWCTLVALTISASGAFAWSGFNRPSWSGSGSSGSGKATTQPAREVMVGSHRVMLPGDANITRISDDQIIWTYDGVQTLGTEKVDVLSAMGIVLPKLHSAGEWTYSWGSNGHGVVYQARHKMVDGLYVHGVAQDERWLKALLLQISVMKAPSTQPAI